MSNNVVEFKELTVSKKIHAHKEEEPVRIFGWLDGADQANKDQRTKLRIAFCSMANERLKAGPEQVWKWDHAIVVTTQEIMDKVTNGFVTKHIMRFGLRWVYQCVNGVDESKLKAELPPGTEWHLIRMPHVFVEKFYGKAKRPTEDVYRQLRIAHKARTGFAVLICQDNHPFYKFILEDRIREDEMTLIKRKAELKRITKVKLSDQTKKTTGE